VIHTLCAKVCWRRFALMMETCLRWKLTDEVSSTLQGYNYTKTVILVIWYGDSVGYSFTRVLPTWLSLWPHFTGLDFHGFLLAGLTPMKIIFDQGHSIADPQYIAMITPDSTRNRVPCMGSEVKRPGRLAFTFVLTGNDKPSARSTLNHHPPRPQLVASTRLSTFKHSSETYPPQQINPDIARCAKTAQHERR
jgi:hypothetical protein